MATEYIIQASLHTTFTLNGNCLFSGKHLRVDLLLKMQLWDNNKLLLGVVETALHKIFNIFEWPQKASKLSQGWTKEVALTK